jgi:hypothetical protein
VGGRGAMMRPVGDRVYEYKTVEIVDGIKVLEPIKKKGSWSVPYMSNTPGTSYIKLADGRKTAELRIYGKDRMPVNDFAYGQHDGIKFYHVHTWKDGEKIGTRPMTRKELEKYGKLFKKVGLRI